jgi:murein DD-endopeptidase MepM/ murein hydrolase activator NlpD
MPRIISLPVFSLLFALLFASLACQLFTGAPELSGALPTAQPFPPGQEDFPSAPPPEARPTGEKSAPPSPSPEAPAGKPAATAAADQTIPLEGDPCPEEMCIVDGSFLLARPIGEGGRNTTVAASPYGSYHRATRLAQRGVYFLNSSGTPVLAAADGKVVFAGDDREVPMGPFKDLYGNTVIIKHNFSQLGKPLFTVYAHLSEVEVGEGEDVYTGQEIGQVGSSGSATGSTLLFEVRLGKNHFQNTSNPELWLKPLRRDGKRLGAIAGRFENKNGKAVQVANIVLEQLAGPGLPAIETFYLSTYTGKRQSGQAPWIENFAAGDLPPGEYQISYIGEGGSVDTQLVTVEPGRLTLVAIVVNTN